MTDEQANDVIDNTLKAHWPNWEFRGQELKVWLEELRKFDYDTAKTAINELYKTWVKDRYPKMPHIMVAIRNQSQQKHKNARIVALFGIFRQNHQKRWYDFFGSAETPKQEIEKVSEHMRAKANEIEPNHYIMYYQTDEEEDEGYYGDPELSIFERRRQARDKAFEDILDGPENKTKCWLQNYLNSQKTEKKEKKGPVQIGEMVAGCAPL